MSKIKVLNLIASMGAGGAQQVVINYLREFQNDPDIDFKVCVYYKKSNSKYDREIQLMGYNVEYLNYPRTIIQIPYLRRFFQEKVAIRNWTKIIKEYKPDIVHVHISGLLKETLPGIKEANVPIVFDTLHSCPNRYQNSIKDFISNAFVHEGVIPICLTQEQADSGKEWYGFKNYEIVRNGIDLDEIKLKICDKESARKKLGLKKDDYIVIGVGRLASIKHFDLLIEAFSYVLQSNQKAKLVFAGDGEEKNNLVKKAELLGVDQNVIFMGAIDNVENLYCAADVMAITSISEACSLTLLEAQVCQLRCVVSHGVPSETIVSSNIKRMNSNATPREWGMALLEKEFKYPCENMLTINDYDVHKSNITMKDIYLKYYYKKLKGN